MTGSARLFRFLRAAAAVAVLVLVIYFLWPSREGFTPRARKVYETSRDLFARDPDATFSEFKVRLDVDSVEYDDVKGLWRDKKLTLPNVAAVLAR